MKLTLVLSVLPAVVVLQIRADTIPNSPLSKDQQIFESLELHGGEYTIGFNFPAGGGTLVSPFNYFYSVSSGGLAQSPVHGPEIQTQVLTTLDQALPASVGIAPFYNIRVIKAGVAIQLPFPGETVQRRITYQNGGIRADTLDLGGTQVLE